MNRVVADLEEVRNDDRSLDYVLNRVRDLHGMGVVRPAWILVYPFPREY